MKKSLIMIALALAATSEDAIADVVAAPAAQKFYCTIAKQSSRLVFNNQLEGKFVEVTENTTLVMTEDTQKGTRYYAAQITESGYLALSVGTLSQEKSEIDGVALGAGSGPVTLLLPSIDRSISCNKGTLN